jgi:D-alanyl-D-alanine carboxypeptidase
MGRQLTVLALVAAVLVLASGNTASAQRPGAKQIIRAMNTVKAEQGYRAHIFGVWRRGRPVVVRAAGSSQDGVPATKRMHFWSGNTGESMAATALYRLAEQGKVRLDAPLSNWYPDLPNASSVTLQMLADSVTGYNDFVTTDAFLQKLYENTFRIWSVPEILGYAFSEPPGFDPGTSWAFSDTNYVILGDVIGRIARKSPERVIQKLVINPLRLRHTRLSPIANLPEPALHAYTTERGVYEDATYWNNSWARGAGDIYSTVPDLARWARHRVRGTLLKRASRRTFFTPRTAGIGPFTPERFYTNATINDAGWVYNNPSISGYTVMVAHHRATDATVVVVTTINPTSNVSVHFATLAFQRLTQLLTPNSLPRLNPCPRGGC